MLAEKEFMALSIPVVGNTTKPLKRRPLPARHLGLCAGADWVRGIGLQAAQIDGGEEMEAERMTTDVEGQMAVKCVSKWEEGVRTWEDS